MHRFLPNILAACLAIAIMPARADDESSAGEPDGSAPASDRVTLWIAGETLPRGRNWGQELDKFLDPQKIQVVNSAANGAPLPVFATGGKWADIAKALKPGDFVLLHFRYANPNSSRTSVPKPPALRPFAPTPFPSRGKLKQAENNHKGLQPPAPSPPSPQDTAEAMRKQGGLLRKMAMEAHAKQAQVLVCSPIPLIFWSRPMPGGAPMEPSSVMMPKPEWSATLKSSAQTEGATFVDLTEIGGKVFADLNLDKLNSIATIGPPNAGTESATFHARMVLAALRGMPGSPLDSYLNNDGRAIPPHYVAALPRQFTSMEGKTFEGTVVSATGDSAVIQRTTTGQKVTVKTDILSEADRQFIRQWKIENPSFQLTYDVTRIANDFGNAKPENRTYCYEIRITNASKDPTPELKLYYHYNRKVRTRGDGLVGDLHKEPDYGNLVVPTIPAGGSVTLATARIHLDDQTVTSQSTVRMSDGTRRVSIDSSSRKEVLNGIAFDLYLGNQMVGQYRAHGFMNGTKVGRY